MEKNQVGHPVRFILTLDAFDETQLNWKLSSYFFKHTCCVSFRYHGLVGEKKSLRERAN